MTDTAGRNPPAMPAGRELDAAVWCALFPEVSFGAPPLSVEWNAMRLVVERLAALAWDVEMNAVATQQAGRSCLCVLRTYTPELVVIAEAADTLPHAVALAALKAVTSAQRGAGPAVSDIDVSDGVFGRCVRRRPAAECAARDGDGALLSDAECVGCGEKARACPKCGLVVFSADWPHYHTIIECNDRLIARVREQEQEIADLRVECRVYERASTVDAPQELARLAELHRRPTLGEVLAVLAPPGFTQDYDGAVPLYDVRARLRGLFADVAAR